jgi:hypothetical protein
MPNGKRLAFISTTTWRWTATITRYPHALIKKQLDVRITKNTINCFHRSQPVAGHRRSYQKGRHATIPAQLAEAHRQAVFRSMTHSAANDKNLPGLPGP